MINYIVLSNAVSLTLDDGDNHVITTSHPNYNSIINAIKAKNWSVIAGLIDIPKAISVASKGAVTVKNGSVYFNDLPVHSYLATRILDLMTQGFDISPWKLFMEKLYSNPDPYSITQLYEFLERAKLPICPDGDFLAYKKVRGDYTDCHTGRFDNSIGKEVVEDRAICDNNPNNTCSKGLHFCSKGYLASFGGSRTLIVKVNPRDVVSIPSDHNAAKARACRYLVVGELNEDYTHEDMETSAVLPSPRDLDALNVKKKTVVNSSSTPNALQRRVLESDAWSVRDLAKNLGVTQADIINSAGVFYKFQKGNGDSLGNMVMQVTYKGRKAVSKLVK